MDTKVPKYPAVSSVLKPPQAAIGQSYSPPHQKKENKSLRNLQHLKSEV